MVLFQIALIMHHHVAKKSAFKAVMKASFEVILEGENSSQDELCIIYHF